MITTCKVLDLGQRDYRDTLDLQHRLLKERHSGSDEDYLLFVEHPPVLTVGRGGDGRNILANSEILDKKGVSIYEVERGGDITFHGPGQVVGYPIFDLNQHGNDLHRYLRNLEEVIIVTLERYGLKGKREKGLTGVWVDGEKVAAIGIAVKHWITFHGFALNVNTDLSYFDLISPCGISDRGVTSMERLKGSSLDMSDVKEKIVNGFAEVFGIHPHLLSSPIKGEELPTLLFLSRGEPSSGNQTTGRLERDHRTQSEKLTNILSPLMGES
jgi:lipoate-protein ligase B